MKLALLTFVMKVENPNYKYISLLFNRMAAKQMRMEEETEAKKNEVAITSYP